jgi:hypothetical protein
LVFLVPNAARILNGSCLASVILLGLDLAPKPGFPASLGMTNVMSE